jgi:hypothetical protein
MKYCIIRRVPFKTPGKQSRIVWANVLCEHEGLALILVPQTDTNQLHSIYIATENFAEHVFEAVVPHHFDLGTDDLKEAGNKLWIMGESLSAADLNRRFRPDDFD